MTRMEKYANYRKEISDNGLIQSNTNSYSSKIDHFKKTIEKLNCNIKVEPEKTLEYIPMYVIDSSVTMLPAELVNALKLINDIKLELIHNNVNDFFSHVKNQSIWDNDKNGFKESWLFNNASDHYNEFYDLMANKPFSNMTKDKVKIEYEDLYSKSRVNNFTQLTNIRFHPIRKIKDKNKKIYFATIGTVLFIFLMFIIFIITTFIVK